jgi:hypothetical protein
MLGWLQLSIISAFYVDFQNEWCMKNQFGFEPTTSQS